MLSILLGSFHRNVKRGSNIGGDCRFKADRRSSRSQSERMVPVSSRNLNFLSDSLRYIFEQFTIVKDADGKEKQTEEPKREKSLIKIRAS